MLQPIHKSILITASTPIAWQALTNLQEMKQWMGDAEMKIEIITDWKVGKPIVIKGFHHAWFENKGTVLKFQPNKTLSYNYLSSMSQLKDKPENYTTLEFNLEPSGDSTMLKLTVSNFPTEAIFKHLEFYWNGTLSIIKNFVEKR